MNLLPEKNAVMLHREELPSFTGETYCLDALFFLILKCNIKNVLLGSSEGGHLQLPVCVCGISGMHTSVCSNN